MSSWMLNLKSVSRLASTQQIKLLLFSRLFCCRRFCQKYLNQIDLRRSTNMELCNHTCGQT